MEMGQRVKTLDGSFGIIVSIFGGVARVCYLAPNNQLSYIADNHLLVYLTDASAGCRDSGASKALH